MLYRLTKKEDVLDLLYAIGEGRGLPKGAVEYLTPFVEFHPASQPSGFEIFQISNSQGDVLLSRETPRHQPKMFFHPTHRLYEPQLEDFELRFELPAIAFAHYVEGFDRTGDFTVAIFDIQPVVKLGTPTRFQVRSRLLDSVCAHLTATDVGMDEAGYGSKLESIHQASETDVRQALGAHFGRDFSTDESLAPYLLDFGREFSLLFTFIRGESWADYERREAQRKDSTKSR